MRLTCTCETTFDYEITGEHDDGHTHATCPSCGLEWTIQPDAAPVVSPNNYRVGSAKWEERWSSGGANGPSRRPVGLPPFHAVPLDQVVGVDELDRTALDGAWCEYISETLWPRRQELSEDWCPKCAELVG